MGVCGLPCSLRNVIKTLGVPMSPRKGSALVSSTHSGTGRVQPRRGLGVNLGVQQLDSWSITLLPLEVCEAPSRGGHSHPSRDDGAEPVATVGDEKSAVNIFYISNSQDLLLIDLKQERKGVVKNDSKGFVA